MTLPYVTDVTIKDGQVVLTVELDKYLANEPVEISGYATQGNGAFATFYDLQSVDENPAGKVFMYVTATPSAQFQSGEAVTVALRASRVWVTVLTATSDGPGAHEVTTVTPAGPATPDGTTWNNVTAVGWASDAMWRASQAAAGSDPRFPKK